MLNVDINIDNITYANMTDEQFNNPQYKNKLIGECKTEYIVCVNDKYADVSEVKQIVDKNDFLLDYNMVIFGENMLQGEVSYDMFIKFLYIKPYVLILKKAVFAVVGCFNERLVSRDIYELALRVAYEFDNKINGLYSIECIEDNSCQALGSSLNVDTIGCYDNILFTYANVIRKYVCPLKTAGLLEDILSRMTDYAEKIGYIDEFNLYLTDLLNDNQLYQRIEYDTAPYYIIIGDDICYGVLKWFAVCITENLISNGQAVIVSDGSYGKKVELKEIENKVLKGIIGFQAPVLFKEYFKNINCNKYIYWFDHPMYFRDMFKRIDDKYYLLCQDKYYAEFMSKYYNINNAVQFPPAGKDAGFINNMKREYNIVFIGSYHTIDDCVIQDDFQREYYDYMISNPEYTFEQGLNNLIGDKKLIVKEQENN